MSSIMLGVAALVAINSFNYNLRKEIDKEAATLLGADLAASGNRPAEPEILKVLDSLPGEKAREMELLSMSYIPKTDETQFIRLKALEGNYPFYGKIKTLPLDAAVSFRRGPSALVDESLMLQHSLVPGDSIKIGKMMFEIKGRLSGAVGSIGAASSVAPAIYINIASIDSTGLIQSGSLINYAYYYKVPETFDIELWKSKHKSLFRSDNIRMETIEDRKTNLNRAFGFLNYFLNMVAIVALLLGCLGVASSVLIYVKSKTNSIGLLRCLGMKPRDAFLVYFIQIMVLGFIGVVGGVLIGVFIQSALPLVLQDFLPVEVNITLSPRAITEGFFVGLSMTTLFSLIPLVSIRNISPLQTLRVSVDEGKIKKDYLKTGIYVAIIIVLMVYLWILTSSLLLAFGFVAGIVLSYSILSGFAYVVTKSIRRFIPANAGFVFKQGLSNLFRPDNQTRTIMVTLGMGTAVLTTLIILQSILLNNVSLMDSGKQPNMILYGIEANQMENLKTLTNKSNLPVIQEVPVVTMKIDGWKGKTKTQWLADTTMAAERWAVNREARVTYRDTISNDELLMSGKLRKYHGLGDSIFISLGTTFAEAMDVSIGDEVVFNVQGTRMVTYVGSLREIEFRNLSTRFFIVFPTGVLEEAPQFQVLVTKTPDNITMTKYRAEVVKTFPNISVIDLTTILQSVNDILKKVSFIIQFMAIFSLLTGLVVLISSLTLSKYQRLRESILLRTIGATRIQIIKINATEYAFLGILSAVTGVSLALIFSYILTKFQLQLDFNITWWPVFAIASGLMMITIIIGLINSRDVINNPPLEVLRRENN
ncbi:MAG: FtsX-like permease family protein [Saprospiraceae bacterium]|nr:FtsX-like permease family protein [Saprospiraceae bacterium]